jgi:methylmalonyl-CoA mutase N-terminal domain/subunit
MNPEQLTDPLAGSYAIESLTNEIEREAMEYISKIDDMGGMLRAIEKGYVQKQIQDAAYEYQKNVESGENVVVGVNKFQTEEEERDFQLLRVDESVGKMQIEKLRKLKEKRDNIAVQNALDKIRKASRDTSENLMPKIIDAVRYYATEGEICGVLREEFGEYTENIVL